MRLLWGIVLCAYGVLGLAANVARGQDEPSEPSAWERAKDLAGAAQEKVLPAGADRPPPVMHRYVNKKGRIVYTNIEESVPLEQHAAARMDLSGVPLNTELGNELRERLREEYKALIKTPYCQKARAVAEEGFWSRLWGDYSPLVTCAGVLLLFLLYTPTAIKRFGGPNWAKTLMTAIPVLTISGLMAFSTMRTNQALGDLKRSASLCKEETFDKLGKGDNPVQKHQQLIDQLKQQIAAIDAEAGYRSLER